MNGVKYPIYWESRYNGTPYTVEPVFKTTWEIGTTWELGTTILFTGPMQYIDMDLGNKTTSEFRTVFHSPFGVPNSQVPLYVVLVFPSPTPLYFVLLYGKLF